MDEHADSLWSVSHTAPCWQHNVTGGAFMSHTGYNLIASRGNNQSQSIHYTDRALKRRGEDREIKRGELQPFISSASLSPNLHPSSPNRVIYTCVSCLSVCVHAWYVHMWECTVPVCMSYFPMVEMVGRVEEVPAITPMEIGVQVCAVCLFF